MVHAGSQRGRPAGQAIVAEVEDAIDVYFKNSIPVDDVTRPPQTNYKRIQAATVRLSRSRPVIPPLLELQLIQLGNKLTVGEAEVARSRFRRIIAPAFDPFSASPPREFLATTDAEGNSVVGRVTSSAPTLTRARCCNCPEVAVPDAVVDQLVRAMRKVVLDILEDNATSSLLRTRVSRQKLPTALRDDRVRTAGPAFPSSSSTPSALPSCAPVPHPVPAPLPRVATITPAPQASPLAAEAPPEPPSVASSPSSSSPSSLFSSPSSSTSSAVSAPVSEVRKDPGRSEVLASTGHDEELMSVFRSEAEAGSSPAPSSLAPGDAKAAEPHFLRSPRRVEDNPAVAHSFPRFRDDGGALPPRRPSSPLARKSGHAPKGDELQVRLNAILRSSHREDDAAVRLALRPAPDPKFDEEASASPPALQPASSQQCPPAAEHPEGAPSFDSDDSWSHCEEATPPKSSKQDSGKLSVRDAPLSDAVPKGGHPFTAPSLLSAHAKAPSMWLEPVEDSRKPSASIFSKTHRYSVFTISGTLADPFGTNARYSLRSLSTAHF
ncbi:uncharacterized protein [Penaeus vannamei]|uniref:uncharacterized protein isoform X2 n=1 Tax=Penaeus vannamei TaxID=6689 RepID=UPI00387F54C0